jgi:hypothetical protein
MATITYFTTTDKNHRHLAYLSENGTGRTNTINNHAHTVFKYKVQVNKNHIHRIVKR